MSSTLFSLAGKRALVTGSSQGLGLAIAKALATAGADVVLNGRDEAKLAKVAAALQAEGLKVEAQAFDVTSEESVKTGVSAVLNRLGPIHILVNNAGIQRRHAILDLSLEDWDAVIRMNLTSAFLVAKAVAPQMISEGAGKIINICSLMSSLARPTISPYSASKGGLKMLTQSMTVEWARHNIQTNGIGPGYMLTELTAPLSEDPKFDSWIKARTPANRWGKPEELGGAAVFLASEASSFINGQILYVDGGITAAV
jgi:gluconate 5-dehydrogenase